ncbi:GTP 3',8-cyclase MoaA [Planctomicrobium piriforme]|uniref:GTP 3',8-cyclase n=1 Tax=Planctomicrobium piriforme TaxID=1576369 RepID=A0A1I3F529_9PLAN|nr:GTP 3',8-cyclase MoaA [Planctomicrobium piriforme]SFI05891.1 cyclic pyranopterin phosphate synthase [Planctomicrobium piriforme]
MNELPLLDQFGRRHTNLRISVTDRCNIRCFYCMPAENVRFMNRRDLLSFEEIEQVVRLVVPLGVTKIRLTGGEPLVRRDLSELVRRLVAVPGVLDLGLTTNGILLEEQAESLYAAGLRRLNVSLDALSAEAFRLITRRDGYERVLAGIAAAQKVGFAPIKINAVAVRGLTESEIVPFAKFARESGCEVRFIEYMPLDADAAWERGKVLFASEIREILAQEFMPLEPVGEPHPEIPASEYVFADGVGRIGFIPSVSEPFCANCNRFRITADGKLRSCLFSLEETDLRSLLRGGASDTEMTNAVRACIHQKWAGHHINAADFVQPERPMYSIGG